MMSVAEFRLDDSPLQKYKYVSFLMDNVHEESLRHDAKPLTKTFRASLMYVVLTSHHSQIPSHVSFSLETRRA
jgi:hypothetical protein